MSAAMPLDFAPLPPDPMADLADDFAAALEAKLRERTSASGGEALLDFIPRISPRYRRPNHLEQIASIVERAVAGEPVRALISVPPRFGKPLGKDTRVTMADGSLRAISTIRVGDRVISGAGRTTTVTAVFEQGVLPVSRVTTRSGRTFLAEGSHRFLTQRGWVRVDEIKPYDRKAWRRPRGDSLLVGAQYTTEPVDVSIDVSKFLGYMAGDGNTTQRNCRWTNIDPGCRAEFARVVRALGGDVREHDAQTLGVVSGAGRSRRTVEEQRAWHAAYEAKRRKNPLHREARSLGGHHLKELLKAHGLDGTRAPDKVVPSAIFTAQKEAVEAFVSALFECDGYRGTDTGAGSSAVFYSTSRALLDGVQALLGRLGIRSSLYAKRGKYKGTEHLSWQLSIQDQARFFETMPLCGAKAGAKASSRRHQRDHQLPDGAISIETAGAEECFCITVADDESFLAEGLITHNTELVLHSIGWALKQRPETMMAYVTYAAQLANSKSRSARDYAKLAGVETRDDADALHEWITPAGGGLRAAGIGGPLTGQGFQIVFIDDPTKNRQEAESAIIRERNYSWFTSTAMTRLTPTGAAIVVHTRWHEDDLIGRLEKEAKKYEESGGTEGEPWEVVNLQAIDEETGESLWPEQWPVPVLEKRRRTVGEYDWASLFQGQPRPKGGKLFREPTRYEKAETAGRRIFLAVDVAGTKKSRANWTVAVAMAFEGSGDTMKADILEVLRLQEEIPEVCRQLETFQGRWSGAPMIVEASGLGKAVPQTLRDTNPRLRLVEVFPTTDKFARAQAYAAGWNQGRVRLAQSGTGLADFIRVTTGFTGVNDAEDDDVDAGAHCWNYAVGQAPMPITPQPKPKADAARPRFGGGGGGLRFSG